MNSLEQFTTDDTDIDSSVMYGEYYDLIQLMTAAVASVVAILVVLCQIRHDFVVVVAVAVAVAAAAAVAVAAVDVVVAVLTDSVAGSVEVEKVVAAVE